MDVRDSVRAYWSAYTDGVDGEIYNIGGTESATVGEILTILMSKSEANIDCIEDASLLRPKDVTLQIPNTEKFRRQTGWRAEYSLEDSIDFLLKELRSSAGR
jgi:nucleoside-diphosphate-sugar epimerase